MDALDHLLGLESKDIDLEVHHLEPETLVNIIEQFQPYKAVGKSFGVEVASIDTHRVRSRRIIAPPGWSTRSLYWYRSSLYT